MEEAEYPRSGQEEEPDNVVETLSEQALQKICNEAVEEVESLSQNSNDPNFQSDYKQRDSSPQQSEEYANSANPSLEKSPQNDPEEYDENQVSWSIRKEQEEAEHHHLPESGSLLEAEDLEPHQNLSERHKKILEDFRQVPQSSADKGYHLDEMRQNLPPIQPREQERQKLPPTDKDFKTGSFRQGDDHQYYSEAFSFSKDQVAPEAYPENEYEGREEESEMYEQESINRSNYISLGERDIDIAELSGFQQLKMKNQMMLSTSQIINYHR